MSKACLCFGDVKVVIRGVQVSMEAVCSIILLEKCLLFKIHLFHSCICSCSLQQFLADVVCLNGNQRLQKKSRLQIVSWGWHWFSLQWQPRSQLWFSFKASTENNRFSALTSGLCSSELTFTWVFDAVFFSRLDLNPCNGESCLLQKSSKWASCKAWGRRFREWDLLQDRQGRLFLSCNEGV